MYSKPCTPLFKLFVLGLLIFTVSCDRNTKENTKYNVNLSNRPKAESIDSDAVSSVPEGEESPFIDSTTDASAILSRPEVPILCYHQIRDWAGSDSKLAKTYIVPERRFEEHIKMLADSGYHTILPDQLMAYLTTGASLPEKPIMLTFDDTNLTQYETATPILEKYNFKGVFFIMTVSLGRPRYMSKAQVKDLAARGHAIGNHTWDHHQVKKYESQDWETQVSKPKQDLGEITGAPINYFAYPFGLWNTQGIPELKNRGIKASFQLAAKRDSIDPLHTIRRIIASGYWSPNSLYKNIKGSFHKTKDISGQINRFSVHQ
ncbi:polysaccharide deacetylase family protein [Pontibacter oryzae]|uniref:Polysaccharide deacetylase family protein n=1 Tax=Pontibacter oryzae TaxID=2304593 RepID=A0A399SFH6_9BACT|nr:polysaccharide deacetylase family protein [Pontibacter oryzae]RIJ41958.1 polysaccharide deacetylase family protein [Pontibacter oryzae]